MIRSGWAIGVLGLALAMSTARGQDGPFSGEWRTTLSTVTLKQAGADVTGSYGNAGQFTIKGTAAGKELDYEFQEGGAKGKAHWTLDASGLAFTGKFQVEGGNSGAWNGWKPDPDAPKGTKADFGKTWLTSLGLMELTQDEVKVKGRFGLRGGSDFEGDAAGRRLDYRFKAFRGGQGWFDLSGDGKSLAGAAKDDGTFGWFAWTGRPAPEFAHHAKLKAGQSVDGATDNLLTYTVRAPEGYREGDKKTWPTVVILHGSNMNGRSYVETIAATWPDLARDFILLGINGERPSNTGPDPRFNFSYVNFVGKSTFKGFPGTDRESPALVAEALTDLRKVYPIGRYLVGGHSQGGFLTYSLMMNYPELVAGAFPISAGLIFQCEPSAYADVSLKEAQRKVPLVVIHGKTDPIVDPSLGQYAAGAFREAGWPALRFIEPDQGGHAFALLPVAEAVRWLDTLASGDFARLVDFAEARLKAGAYRDAIAAVNRTASFMPDPPLTDRLNKVRAAIDAQAGPKAKAFLGQIKGDKADWVDAFLAFRDEFQYADAARGAMVAFDDLRARHEGPAQQAFNEARGLFRQGKTEEGYKKYREIVDRDFASPLYRTVKKALAERR